MKTMTSTIAFAAMMCAAMPAAAQQAQKIDPAVVEKAYQSMFGKAPPEWQQRMAMDETQKICSETRNEPSNAQFDAILKREQANVIMPADRKVVGDWKAGRQIAQRGTGGQFSDAPGTPVGGNCYACHQMSKAELSFGTLGPSLLEYGKIRKYDEDEAKRAYAKVYNAQSQAPCSMMPRFGHTRFLTEQQIKDVVGYLFDPESPVNK
jgi:L-cysteine S-thiosulfotransferase